MVLGSIVISVTILDDFKDFLTLGEGMNNEQANRQQMPNAKCPIPNAQ
jgi:hypothetical protein